MRDQNDIISVRVITTRDLDMDLELLEQSPRFRSIKETICAAAPDSSPMEINEISIKAYIGQYILIEEFPQQTPGTTGPGSVTQVQVEVGSNASISKSAGEADSAD